MSNKERIVGIPKNRRLKEEVQPILQQALALERKQEGVWSSPYLQTVRFVEMKIPDLIKFLRQRFIDLALISDDKGLEEQAAINNGKYFNNYDQQVKIERCFGLGIKGPPLLRALAKEESKDEMLTRIYGPIYKEPVYSGEKAVTSYPELMRYYFRRKFNKIIQSCNTYTVCGQVESFMRNEVLPKTVIAYDIVSTGATSRKFGLTPVDSEDDAYKAYPSLWCKDRDFIFKDDISDWILPELKRRIGAEIELDERTEVDIL